MWEHWTQTADLKRRILESKHLKTNATEGCLAHHTENTIRSNAYTYGNRSMSGLQESYCQLSFMHCKLSWFGHVCGHDKLPKIIQHGRQSAATASNRNLERRILVDSGFQIAYKFILFNGKWCCSSEGIKYIVHCIDLIHSSEVSRLH